METKANLQISLAEEGNLARLRQLPGIRQKTVDYLQMLAGLDTTAIHRHPGTVPGAGGGGG